MKFILLAIIRTYWRWVPEHRRRRCLFSESCSRHVYRVTSYHGLGRGLGALAARWRECRPGASPTWAEDGTLTLRLATGRVVLPDEIAPDVLDGFQADLHALERRLSEDG